MVTWWLWLVLGGIGGGIGPPLGFLINLLVIWLVLELASESGAKNGGKVLVVDFLCHLKKNWHSILHLYVHLSTVKHFLYVDHFLWKNLTFFAFRKNIKQFSRYVNFKGLCPTKLDGWNFVVLVNSGINKQIHYE